MRNLILIILASFAVTIGVACGEDTTAKVNNVDNANNANNANSANNANNINN